MRKKGRKLTVVILGKKSTEGGFDRRVSKFGRTYTLRILLSAKGKEREEVILRHAPCMAATNHWKDRNASSSCHSSLSRLLTEPPVRGHPPE